MARLVCCGDCRHFIPDVVNPPGGIGTCAINASGVRWQGMTIEWALTKAERRADKGLYWGRVWLPPLWPMTRRMCDQYQQREIAT